MKKKVLVTLCAMIFFAVSCSKIDSESIEEYENLYTFDVSVISGILSFTSVLDYDATIQYIGENDQNIGTFDNLKYFNSLLSVSDPGFIEENCGDLFASILNHNAKVIIDGRLFSFDFESRKIHVSPVDLQNPKKSTFTNTYSFDDDVNEIVFGNGNSNSKKKGVESYCPSYNPDWITESTRWGDIELHMRYLKLGIYYELRAKMHKTFPDNIYMKVYTQNSYCCWKNKKDDGTVGTEDDCSSCNNVKIKPYKKRFRLKKYYFGAYFDARECENCSSEYQWDLEIDCDCSDCSWIQ